MDQIDITYGETVVLPFDADDLTAVTADIFIGKPGQVYILTKSINLVDGKGTFTLTDEETKLPRDTFYYQINVEDALGQIEKYPNPDSSCTSCEYPKFIVHDSLDRIEVS